MSSYQDLEVRFAVVEDRLNFLMDLMRLAQPSPIEGAPPKVTSMNDLYLASKAAGLKPAPTSEESNGQ